MDASLASVILDMVEKITNIENGLPMVTRLALLRTFHLLYAPTLPSYSSILQIMRDELAKDNNRNGTSFAKPGISKIIETIDEMMKLNSSM